MEQFLPWASGLLLAGFALSIAYFVLLAYGNSLLLKEERNHFRNSFPYEFYKDFPFSYRLFLYVILSLNILFVVLGMSFFFLALDSTYALCLLFFLALSAFSILASNLLPLSHYKGHIIAALSGFSFLSLGSILFSFITIIPGGILLERHVLVPIAVIVGIVGFLFFFALFNPKLKNWARLDRTEENGATYYVKPKVNFLSLYEWIALALLNLESFLLFLDIILTQGSSLI